MAKTRLQQLSGYGSFLRPIVRDEDELDAHLDTFGRVIADLKAARETTEDSEPETEREETGGQNRMETGGVTRGLLGEQNVDVSDDFAGERE